MRIMLCQTQIVWEDKKANIEKLKGLLALAEKQQVSLVCLPEMSFTGFSMRTDITMDRHRETVEQVSGLARQAHVAVAFGYVSPDASGQKAYNHYAVVDENGALLADYVKIHPFSYGGEDQYFSGGDRLVSFSYQGFRVGLAVCYDLRFAEQFSSLADTCDLILIGANWPAARALHWRTLLRARAIENQCYMAGVNCTGRMHGVEYQGDSMLIHPNGELVEHGCCPAGESYTICEIENDVAQYRDSFPVRHDRVEIQKEI